MSLSRPDIHKGAVALEQVAACFHELASAADAIVSAQRKLSKSLRETASSKGCPTIAKNALNASAWMMDNLTEADVKYARTIEREYETLSADLRRWFKKLAKDEREHDDFVALREAKIRQAGELYERRALKKDIAEEYGRYVEILNTHGAEISSAQRQHADETNHRHSTMMTTSAGCIARLADASWNRTCEALRRCAPGVGSVGEARAWCESGWQANDSEPILSPPRSLPDPSFRPPSYRSNTADLAPPSPSSTGSRSRVLSIDSNMRKTSSAPTFAPRTQSPARLAESSTESDLYPEYYSSAASGGQGSQIEGTSLPNASNIGAGVSSGGVSADQPQEPIKVQIQDHGHDQQREQAQGHQFHDTSQVWQADSTSASEMSPKPDPSFGRQWVEKNPASYPSVRQISSQINFGTANSHYPYSSDSPSSYSTRAQQARITSGPAAWTRPVTPNSSRPRSPSWVGKGLRRLSMPTFANNR